MVTIHFVSSRLTPNSWYQDEYRCYLGSKVVEHLTRTLNIKGLNPPTVARRETISKKLFSSTLFGVQSRLECFITKTLLFPKLQLSSLFSEWDVSSPVLLRTELGWSELVSVRKHFSLSLTLLRSKLERFPLSHFFPGLV